MFESEFILKCPLDTRIKPNDAWGGEGLAGLNVRMCSSQSVLEFVWHVLVVQYGSPSDESGLESEVDYIVGSPEMIFTSEFDLYRLLESKIDSEATLFVFSSVTESVRLVTIRPRYGWKGDGKKDGGFLGCDIAFGLSHRLPPYKSLQKDVVDIVKEETTQHVETEKVEKDVQEKVKEEHIPLFNVHEEISTPKKTPTLRSSGTPSPSPLRPAITTPPQISTPNVLPPMLLDTQSEMGLPKNGNLY